MSVQSIPSFFNFYEDFIKWFGGFFDGEGSFSIRVNRCIYKAGYQFAQIVSLEQVSEDNEEIFNNIKIWMDGTVSHREYRNTARRQVQWYISDLEQCIWFAEEIRPFLVIKQGACDKFLEACYMLRDKVHYTREGFLEIARLRGKINSRAKPYNYITIEDIEMNLRL